MSTKEFSFNPDDLHWRAEYDDGSFLLQAVGSEEEKTFKDIELEKLEKLVIYDTVTEEEILSVNHKKGIVWYFGIEINIEMPSGGTIEDPRVIYFRRNVVIFGNGDDRQVRHCVGIQRVVDGVNYQQLVFLNADGTITVSQRK